MIAACPQRSWIAVEYSKRKYMAIVWKMPIKIKRVQNVKNWGKKWVSNGDNYGTLRLTFVLPSTVLSNRFLGYLRNFQNRHSTEQAQPRSLCSHPPSTRGPFPLLFSQTSHPGTASVCPGSDPV